MAKKRNLNDEKITLEDIRGELSSDFKAIFEELQKKLYAESKYKRLKRVGEEQFSNATLQSNEMENQNARLAYAEINLLIYEVNKYVEALVAEKFQGSFLTLLKDKVKRAILKLYSKQKNDAQITSEDYKISTITSGHSDDDDDDEIVILERLKDLSKFCAENLIDIRNQLIGMPLEENEISATANPKKDISSEIKLDKLDNDAANSKENASSKIKKKMNSVAANSKKIPLNKHRVENLDSTTVSPKKTLSNENKVKKLDISTNPKETISRETKEKKIESATTSKKETSSESKVKNLKNKHRVKNLDSTKISPKKTTSDENKVKKLDSSAANPEKELLSESKAKLDNATSNPEKTISSETKVKKLESATTSSESKVKKSATSSKKKSNQSKIEEPKTNKSNNDTENLSSDDSVSLVDTSDLSSFDDEIVFSSDEETGRKRRKMSIKQVQAKIAELKALKQAAENQIEISEPEDESKSEMSVNEPCSISRKSLSQRVRKPNSKYVTDVIQTPLHKSSSKKDTTSSHVSSVDTPLPKKRGRPRKHHNSLD